VAWPALKDEAVLAGLRSRLSGQFNRLPVEFDMSPEARVAWESWYMARPKSVHATRLDGIGFRLMGLIALTTDKDEIDREVVGVVTDILDYEYRIRVLTDPINADNKIAGLEQKIRNVLSANPNQWLSERDLRQRTHADRAGLYFFSVALKNLENISEEVQRRTIGKKASFRLTPNQENVATSVATPLINVNIHMIQ
jgi:hypothetical protein